MCNCICVEIKAYKQFFKVIGQVCCDPKFYTKVSLKQFLTGFLALFHEAITNNGKSGERVAEDILGKGKYQALEGKVAIITGPSNGLGLDNARVLMKYGCTVVWAVRNEEKAKQLLAEMDTEEGMPLSKRAIVLKVELDDLTTIKPFVKSFLALNLPLHYLILNAGVMAPTSWLPSKQGIEKMFSTNNLSGFLMTELLMKKMETTAMSSPVRIIVLSSVMGVVCSNIDLNKVPVSAENYDELADYSVTKCIDVFTARYLQKACAGKNIFAVAVHPGISKTGLLAHNGACETLFYDSMTFAPIRKSVPSCAATTIYCTLTPDLPDQIKNGSFFYYNRRPQKPWGLFKPGKRDELVDILELKQKELVKQYM